MSFNAAFKEVLKHEGGYNFHPSDSGGHTNFGISLRFYKENIDPMADDKTIQSLTKQDAREIYKDYFWEPYKYDQIPHIIAVKLFSFSVNMGHKRAHKLLQRALRASGHNLVDDGILGKKTHEAISVCDPYNVLCALRSEGAGRYRYIALANPELKVFLTGWLNRAYS